jgi:hypothetical protein
MILQALQVMLSGMIGIFIVMGVIYGVISVLGKSGKQIKDESDTKGHSSR